MNDHCSTEGDKNIKCENSLRIMDIFTVVVESSIGMGLKKECRDANRAAASAILSLLREYHSGL